MNSQHCLMLRVTHLLVWSRVLRHDLMLGLHSVLRCSWPLAEVSLLGLLDLRYMDEWQCRVLVSIEFLYSSGMLRTTWKECMYVQYWNFQCSLCLHVPFETGPSFTSLAQMIRLLYFYMQLFCHRKPNGLNALWSDKTRMISKVISSAAFNDHILLEHHFHVQWFLVINSSVSNVGYLTTTFWRLCSHYRCNQSIRLHIFSTSTFLCYINMNVASSMMRHEAITRWVRVLSCFVYYVSNLEPEG